MYRITVQDKGVFPKMEEITTSHKYLLDLITNTLAGVEEIQIVKIVKYEELDNDEEYIIETIFPLPAAKK